MPLARLLAVWAGVARALLAWGGLTGPGPLTYPLGGGGSVRPTPPAAPILRLWVQWDAPARSVIP